MTIATYSPLLAAEEHIVSGKPLTRLEAIALFGVSNLSALIAKMRREGLIIKSRKVPYALAVRRVNKHAVLQPPPNLPVREILLTEYWMSE